MLPGVQRRPKKPSTNKMMTTAPTIQMSLFMGVSFVCAKARKPGQLAPCAPIPQVTLGWHGLRLCALAHSAWRARHGLGAQQLLERFATEHLVLQQRLRQGIELTTPV